jgi:hypothetical protein
LERRDREREENEERRHRERLEAQESQREYEERQREEVLEAMDAQREAISDAAARAEAAAEEQKDAIANRWKLEAQSKAESAHELLALGSHEKALRLAEQALDDDPRNIEASIVAALVLQATSRGPEARKYISDQISLLRLTEYSDDPDVFFRVLQHIPPNDMQLMQPFVVALHESSIRWKFLKDYSHFFAELNQRGFTDDARRFTRTVICNQIETLRTLNSAESFLRVLVQVPNDSSLLQAFSIALNESAPRWPNINDYCIVIDALIERCLPNLAGSLLQTIIPNADSPAYYPLIDTLMKRSLFDEAQALTATLMGRRNSLELEAYWLEIGTRTGAPIQDRLTPFLGSISHDRREETISTFNAIAAQSGRFSDANLTWIRDRIAERDKQWIAERNELMSQRNQQWANQTTPASRTHVFPWVLGGVAILCLAGIAIVVGIFAMASSPNSNTANPNNTNASNANRTNSGANPTDANARNGNSVVSTNTNTSSNVANANTNANLKTNPPVVSSAFTDDFSAQRWSVGPSQFGNMWYQNGEYHMHATKGSYIVMYAPDSKDYYDENATVRIGLRSLDGNPPDTGYGLAVHGEKKDGKLEDYSFLIYNGTGPKYKIVQHSAGRETDLVGWIPSNAIRTGTSPNQIEVRIRDAKLDLYINGQFVTSITDAANYRRGRVGFYTSDVGEVAFDDLEIRK